MQYQGYPNYPYQAENATGSIVDSRGYYQEKEEKANFEEEDFPTLGSAVQSTTSFATETKKAKEKEEEEIEFMMEHEQYQPFITGRAAEFFILQQTEEGAICPTVEQLQFLNMFYPEFFQMGMLVVDQHSLLSLMSSYWKHCLFRDKNRDKAMYDRPVRHQGGRQFRDNYSSEEDAPEETEQERRDRKKRDKKKNNKKRPEGEQQEVKFRPPKPKNFKPPAPPKPTRTKDKEVIVEDEEIVEVDESRAPVSIVFIGHVDAGKSTICGNLMLKTGMIDLRTVTKYKEEAAEKNRDSWWLAYVMDITEEEKSKGKTVEVGRTTFTTPTKRYTVFDAPGHKNYVPNMIMGAATSDFGGLVISARKGEFEAGFDRDGQTREHA